MKHLETFMFWLVSILGSLLPIIIAVFFYVVSSSWNGWAVFYNDGQFYIFSAAFLTSAAYIYFSFKIKNTDTNSILFWISAIILVLASLLYAFKIAGVFSNMEFNKYSSIVIFISALILLYKADHTQISRTDIVGEDHQNTRRMMQRL